jgi:hypothetical protein
MNTKKFASAMIRLLTKLAREKDEMSIDILNSRVANIAKIITKFLKEGDSVKSVRDNGKVRGKDSTETQTYRHSITFLLSENFIRKFEGRVKEQFELTFHIQPNVTPQGVKILDIHWLVGANQDIHREVFQVGINQGDELIAGKLFSRVVRSIHEYTRDTRSTR